MKNKKIFAAIKMAVVDQSCSFYLDFQPNLHVIRTFILEIKPMVAC